MQAHRMDAMTLEPPAALGASDDEQLLGAIENHKSREAFDALFRRHEPAFFNLAAHVTGNRETAAEAVQEAALSIWLSAGSYRPGGNARGWMFRIVVRAGIQQIRKRKKQGRLVESLTAAREELAAFLPDGGMEREEVLSALKHALQLLPELSRQVVTLSYGAGLTQEEVGAALDIPRRTVSFKLEEALTKLRGQLKSAGFAASAPLVNPEMMAQAICSGWPAPAGLQAQIGSLLAEAGGATLQTASRRAAAVKTGAGALVPALLAAGCAAACVFWWQSRVPQAALNSDSPSAQASPPLPQAAQTGAEELPPPPLFRRWTFEAGPPADFKILKGGWDWRPASIRTGAFLESWHDKWLVARQA